MRILTLLFLTLTVTVFCASDYDGWTVGSAYATLPGEINQLVKDVSCMKQGTSNAPTGEITFDTTEMRFETWNGSAYVNRGINKIQAGSSAGLSLFEDGGAGIFVENGGDVGIGTASPGSKLEVVGTMGKTDNITQTAGKQITTSKIQAGSAAGLSLFEDGGAGIFVENGGQVGIGTTTPSCSLEVSGAIASSPIITLSSNSDNQSVAGTNILSVNTNGGSVVIGGLTGGVTGQYLFITKPVSINTIMIRHNEGTGNQDFRLRGSSSIIIGTGYGGAVCIFDGTYWSVCAP